MNSKLFDPYMVSLDTLFDNNFVIPVYQRPYSWGKEEIDDLYNDVINNYDAHVPGHYDGVFTGTIYLKHVEKMFGKYDKYAVIDGQQRITTFSIMFLVIYCIAKERKLEDEKIVGRVKDFLWRYINRENKKDARLLELGNIDKKILIDLFDVAYGKSKNLKKYAESFNKDKAKCEKCILDAVVYFWNALDKRFTNDKQGNEEFTDFVEYILEATQFVIIYVNIPMKQVFEIFESINSKGKKLQEIDLIKSYVFQKIPEQDHDEYLVKWGELITKTNDELEDYLYVFIRAYVRFYRVSLSVKYFKILCGKELMTYYNVLSEEEAIKKLIDELLARVDYYNMLSKESLLPNKLKNSAMFLFYYNSLAYLGYQHPRSLIFKAFCQYNEGSISDDSVKSIVKNGFVFMISFQTINNRDSKDAIPVFEKILQEDYSNNHLDKTKIMNAFNNKLATEGINEDSLKIKLDDYKGYAKQDKSETLVLLAFYESLKNGKVSYDNANIIIKNRSMFHIDHIMAQNPDASDKKLKYYCTKNVFGDDVLALKQGADFPKDIVDGMEYDLFKDKVLHKIGNLRIVLSSKNESKGNDTVQIDKFGSFNSYTKMERRAKEIAKELYKSDLLKIS